jgi:hypothetical protein
LIEDVLSRLSKVKKTGRGNWIACCPAHDDRSPSLTLHAADDGRVLCRCWSGCSFNEIVDAVGLGWEPWFPPKQADDFKLPIRRPFPAGDVLEALGSEAMLVAVAAANVALGVPLTQEDRDRVWEANCRIQRGVEVARG